MTEAAAPRISPKIAVSVVFVAAMFMNIMDITIVNVALPAIGKDLHSTQLDQVSIAFLVSLAIFIPASGWIGDRFGNRRTLLFAIFVFTGASVLCGISTSFNELVFFRFVQGIGGGLLTPVGTAMLMRTFPPAERVRASAILVLPTAIAPATGPLLGGILVQHASWNWVFLVNLPIGILALLFGLFFLSEPPGAHHPGTFDLPGFLLSGFGLALTMYGISEGPSKGWGSGQVLVTLVIGVILLLAMVRTELRVPNPIVALRLFTEPLFASASAVLFSFGAALFGSIFIVSIYLQEGLGKTAQQTGLTTFTQAIGVMIGSQAATRLLYPRLGPRKLTAAALTVYSCFIASLVFVEPGVSLWWLRLQLVGVGFCMGNLFVPLQVAAFAKISLKDTGHASALFNTTRQLGGAVGVAIVYTIVSEIGPIRVTSHGPQLNIWAFRWAFIVAALVAISSLPMALRMGDTDPTAGSTGHAEREPVLME